MKKAIFLDRDGTLVEDVHYCKRKEDIHILPGVESLKKLKGYRLIIITNQSVVGRGYITEKELLDIHVHLMGLLAKMGVHITAVYYCPHIPEDNCSCRKPRAGLIERAIREWNIDVLKSYVIGDSEMDIDMANQVWCESILIGNDKHTAKPDYIAKDMGEAVERILNDYRLLG